MSTVPMICVESVSTTSKLLCSLFDWTKTRGDDGFAELVDRDAKRVLWLHALHAPEHAKFAANQLGSLGHGLTIYVFVSDIEAIYRKARDMQLQIVEELAVNEGAGFSEFTIAEPSGYHFSVADKPQQ